MNDTPQVRLSSFVHPLAFSVYPVLALLASNIEELRPSAAFRSIGIALGATLLLLLLLKGMLGNWEKAAVLASLAVVLFFSYGHLYTALKSLLAEAPLAIRHRYLVPALALLYGIVFWLVRRHTGAFRTVALSLSVMAIAALVIPVATIAVASAEMSRAYRSPIRDTPSPSGLLNGDLPDVYYIILDGYARSDILSQGFGVDNSDFLHSLRDRGFYVADRSTSNYALTRWSLASSLNMIHLTGLFDPDERRYGGILNRMIRASEVRARFERMGYQTVAVASGWPPTEMADADQFVSPESDPLSQYHQTGQLNAFETMLIQSSAILAVNDRLYLQSRSTPAILIGPYARHHDFVLGQFDILDRVASLPGPKFVFVHVISPHEPYVFGAEGQFTSSAAAFTLGDDASGEGGPAERAAYGDQAVFITRRIEGSLQDILARSESRPIIILQGDHGARVGIHWEDPSHVSIREAMSILNAYLLPEVCQSLLYPEITPVNTFAVVFECLDGSAVTRQPDRNYFSSPEAAPDLQDVTDVLRQDKAP